MQFKERKRWVFFGIPWTFTVYTIKEDVITVDRGFLRKVEDDCYMYKVVDVRHVSTFWERIFKLGTIICYTGDTTDKQLVISHIKNSKTIKDFILQASEEARLKRRTLNTLNINPDAVDVVDNVDL